MSIRALQDYIFCSKYGRYQPNLGRRETFKESVDRVIAMHKTKYSDLDISAELEFCRAAMKDQLVLGSQRALQFGGDPILKKNARIFNCSTSYCDRPRFFQECLWMLLCGCGTGFSVQTHHVAKLPAFHVAHDSEVHSYEIPDTIEGWADGLGVLLASYGIVDPDSEFYRYRGKKVFLDYSAIRPKGSPLSSCSGTAPGPEPLKRAFEAIEQLIERCLAVGQDKLRPIDCYDIVMHASDAVLSGGVRRSATICLFSVSDQEMITAKTGDWFIKNPQRGRSNNSAMLLRDHTSFETFESIMKSTKECGEPGFIWCDSLEVMFNPCSEISLYPQISKADFRSIVDGNDESGYWDHDTILSGWATCNLCEINMKACTDEATWTRACKAAAILGTLQAGYTEFKYLGPVTEAIAKREALLGCSMTGMMDNPKLAFDPVLQRKMAALIVSVNEKVAAKIGIRSTARATCVKPAGTTSCILGTSSGIHAQHAKRYFRRAQGNELEIPLQYFELHNPKHVEPSVWSANGTDKIVTFCIEVGDEALTKQSVDALKLLEYVKLTQTNWVDAGRTIGRCAAPFLQHNVSNTINVQPDEWTAVTQYIYDNRQHFAGISLISHSGDKDYPQAPFCQVFTPQEILNMYGEGSLLASGLIVDGLHAFSNNLWAACDCALGIGEKLTQPTYSESSLISYLDSHEAFIAKTDWVRRAKKFSENYFSGDVKKMTYCLKDVSNVHHWADLQRAYQEVDWSLLKEDRDQTGNVTLDSSCSGGRCEILR